MTEIKCSRGAFRDQLHEFSGQSIIGIESVVFDATSHIIILFRNLSFSFVSLCSTIFCRQEA